MRLSDQITFDVHGFDAGLLDLPSLVEATIQQKTNTDEWTFSIFSQNASRTIYRVDPQNPEKYPSLAIKHYHQHSTAKREYEIMHALDEFGVSIAPRPFYWNDNILICEWIHGDVLQQPPSIQDHDLWHRIMALLRMPNNLPFAKFVSAIPMMGTGAQSPADLIEKLATDIEKIPPDNEQRPIFMSILEAINQKIVAEWHTLPQVTLNHLDPRPHHFIYDGYHLRLVGWNHVDWADTAYAIGQICAHPAYEEVPSTHWVWYRWELARLVKDDTLTARSTTYTNLFKCWWALQLPDGKQKQRYLKESQRLFRLKK